MLVCGNPDLGEPSLASGSIFDMIRVSRDSLGADFASTGGAFSRNQTGNDIELVCTVIPEPGAA